MCSGGVTHTDYATRFRMPLQGLQLNERTFSNAWACKKEKTHRIIALSFIFYGNRFGGSTAAEHILEEGELWLEKALLTNVPRAGARFI